jgi:hypothetical protein
MTNNVPRWKCTSYCLCPSSRNTGHFERDDDGVWVRYDDIKHLLQDEPKAPSPEPQCTALGGHDWKPAQQDHEFCAICQAYRRAPNRRGDSNG